MEGLECHICVKSFSECVPRILQCGHTVCNDCISSILSTSKTCPDCRQSIARYSVTDFPVNYSILKAAESSVRCKSTLETGVLKLIEEFTKKEEKLLNLQTNVNKNLKQVSTCKGTLDELTSKWEEKDSIEIKRTLESLKSQLANLPDAVSRETLNSSINSVTLKSEDFENSDKFLSQIYIQILQGVKFTAILNLEKEARYASLSVWENRLKVHSFHSPFCVEPETKVVCFRDLMKCFEESEEMTAFFDVNLFGTLRHRLFLKLNDTHFRSAFIKMCSGESGKSFKGIPVRGFLDGRRSNSFHWICDDIKGKIRSVKVRTTTHRSDRDCMAIRDISKVLFQFNLSQGMRNIHDYCSDSATPRPLQDRERDNSRTHLVLFQGKFSFVKLTEERNDALIIGVVVAEETETCSPESEVLKDTISDCGLSAFIDKCIDADYVKKVNGVNAPLLI